MLRVKLVFAMVMGFGDVKKSYQELLNFAQRNDNSSLKKRFNVKNLKEQSVKTQDINLKKDGLCNNKHHP